MNKIDKDFLSVLFSLLLIAFVRVMPPFNDVAYNGLFVRLVLEVTVLGSLLGFLLLKQRLKPFAFVTVVFALYMMNWVISAENIRIVLSYFNMFALLLLLPEILALNYPLASFLKNVWIVVWVGFSLLAIVFFLVHTIGLIKFTNIMGAYHYYYIPYLGYAVMKMEIPRYIGFFTEPIQFGFFTGFNIVIAKNIFISKKNARYFSMINMLAGLLTFSYAFYIFLGIFLLFWRYVSRIHSKYIYIGAIVSVLLLDILTNKLLLLPFSSQSDRLLRYHLALEYIQELHFNQLLFGAGLEPFQRAIGRGSSSDLIDLFVSRGIFIFFAWAYLLQIRCKYISGLLFYVVLYSLGTNLWHTPLFIIGVAIATSYSKIKYAASFKRNHDTNTIQMQS